MPPSPWELNERQFEAAHFDGGALRVLAGPGTGKTTTVAARVDSLLARGVDPERILLLTFTRRAAREILRRVRALPGREEAARVAGGTFHSQAHHTLRALHGALGLGGGFGLLDPADAADLIDLVRSELGVSSTERRLPRKATLTALYSRVVNTGRPLSEVMAADAPWALERVEEVGTIFSAYVARKAALDLLDFDDLLLYWRSALEEGALGPRLAEAWDHVLVDEFQDVNQLQVDILTGLRRDDPRVTVVGDDAQAVYGFRGASADFLLDAHRHFAPLTTITLEANYRSSRAILEVANALAAEAPRGFGAVLFPARDPGPSTPVRLVECADEREQSAAVAERILELYEAGVALRDQVVLFRTATHSADLEIELSRRRIPFVKYGGLRYLEGAHVKDLLALFRLTDNPRDEMAWFRLLQLAPGVGPARARRALEGLRDEDGRLTSEVSQVPVRWPRAAAALPEEARHLVEGPVAALARRPGETTLAHAERLASALAPLIDAAYENAGPRLVDLGALVTASADAVRLSQVAADQVLESPLSTGDLAGPPTIDEDWLTLSTIHSAKGLEFAAVQVIHLSDGFLPSDMALSSEEGLEEERRLFYVALTRARRHLDLYVPLRYHHHRGGDRHSWAQPSRFLSAAVRATMTVAPRSAEPDEGAPPSVPTLLAAHEVAVRLSELW